MPVLFLDVDWQPLSVRPLKKALKKIISGSVEVVVYSRDRTIWAEKEHKLPSVVRVLRRFKRDRVAIKFSRLNIYTRDSYRCQYCGERGPTEDLTFDHVVPRCQGGRTEWTNIVTACSSCNCKKDGRTPEQAGMRLFRKPVKPRYLPVVMVQMDRRGVPPEWRDYWRIDLE
jgi:5-methylcytosine-specific restriction endonuclease McrA